MVVRKYYTIPVDDSLPRRYKSGHEAAPQSPSINSGNRADFL
jgi:hypothetical protein